MDLVILESPFAGDVSANLTYARACLRDCLRRGESPIASHLLYTQVLDDANKEQRQQGIHAGLAWYRVANRCVVYTDFGISPGMEKGIQEAKRHQVPVEYRVIHMSR